MPLRYVKCRSGHETDMAEAPYVAWDWDPYYSRVYSQDNGTHLRDVCKLLNGTNEMSDSVTHMHPDYYFWVLLSSHNRQLWHWWHHSVISPSVRIKALSGRARSILEKKTERSRVTAIVAVCVSKVNHLAHPHSKLFEILTNLILLKTLGGLYFPIV